MQDILSRYHRRDAMMKMSVIALFGAIVLSVALPFLVPPPAPTPIPPFKPYRAQEIAVVAPTDRSGADALFQQISAD